MPRQKRPCACDSACQVGCMTQSVFKMGHDETVKQILVRDRNRGECVDPGRCARVDWCRVDPAFWGGGFRDLIEQHCREAVSGAAG